MTRKEACAKIDEAALQFPFLGKILSKKPYGDGHINDTFLLICENDDKTQIKYILQRINHEIFRKPSELMDNQLAVTKFLREKIIKNGGNPDRETLNIIPTHDNKTFYLDSIGCYWRAYIFISDTNTTSTVEKPEDFYQSALAFGNFQRQLADFPAETLHETIANFHNTPKRFNDFKEAVSSDICGRVAGIKDEIQFCLDREDFTNIIMNALRKKEIPIRVTHNDTKFNNVMLDKKTGKWLCVVDLDTVMPGTALNDYGDSIRFGANSASEDESNLDKVTLNMELFDIYTKGYVEGCGGSLTKKELEMLPIGAKMMTLECGIRFLMDYIQGDIYFKIHHKNQNLDRARNQFKLVASMESNWNEMSDIIAKYT